LLENVRLRDLLSSNSPFEKTSLHGYALQFREISAFVRLPSGMDHRQPQRRSEFSLLTEWLTTKLELRPGMRVLDVGCGRAASSIFLHREFGVQVWATDLWFDASENMQWLRDAGAQQRVFPIHAEAGRFLCNGIL
jgi:2-polyprenyl-3-methyl-5-hydroxy-6-metoxy-1,4-benzoquinol methylase